MRQRKQRPAQGGEISGGPEGTRVKTMEDTESRRSVVTETMQSLATQASEWRERIDQLEAGQVVDRGAALASLMRLLDLSQNLRDAVLSEDSSAIWRSKDELHGLVARLDDAAVKRQKILDLAARLTAGTVTHRRERTREERLAERDAAVRELMEKSAQSHAPELPGPMADKWLEWACSLDDTTAGEVLASLNREFPRLDDFVRQLEIEMWHDGDRQPRSRCNRAARQVRRARAARSAQLHPSRRARRRARRARKARHHPADRRSGIVGAGGAGRPEGFFSAG